MIWADGRYVAVGYEGGEGRRQPLVATSTDGAQWTKQVLPSSDVQGLQAVTHGDGRFVALGPLGDGLGSGGFAVFTSPDGVTWTESTTRPAGQWRAVLAYGSGAYVAAVAELWSSRDGNNWTRSQTWHGLLGVTFGGGRFVAVGGSRGQAYSSIDGFAWFSDDDAAQCHRLLAVTYAPSLRRFVAAGEAVIMYADAVPTN